MSSEELLIDDHEFETPLYVSVAKFEESRVRRDKQGRFAEKASLTFDGRDIQVTKRFASEKLVSLDVAAFDAEFQKEKGFYIGAGGKDAIHTYHKNKETGETWTSDRYKDFGKWIAEHDSMQASEIVVQADGSVGFHNGRHRYAYLRDRGLASMPVAMSPESVANAQKHGLLAKVKKAWDESKVVRDKEGQFAEKPSLAERYPVEPSTGGFAVKLPGGGHIFVGQDKKGWLIGGSTARYPTMDDAVLDARLQAADREPKPKPPFKSSTAEEAEAIIAEAKEKGQRVLFHSGDASQAADLAGGIRPQMGAWVQEVLSGATDDEEAIRQIEEDPANEIAFYSETPEWVSMKASRAIEGRHVTEITPEELEQHGHLSIVVVNADEEDLLTSDENQMVYQVGSDDGRREELPMGVEPGDIFTRTEYVPDATLTGKELLRFLNRNYPKANLLKGTLETFKFDPAQRRDKQGRWTKDGGDPPAVGPRIGFIGADGKEHVGRKTGGLGGYSEDHTDTARRLLDKEYATALSQAQAREGDYPNAIRMMLEQGAVRYWVRRGELALNFKDGHENAGRSALKFLEDNFQHGDRIYLDIEGPTGVLLGKFFDNLREANTTIRRAAGMKVAWQSIAKGEHAFGNTQIQIAPTSKAATSLNLARSVIYDEHCMGTGKDVDPNHVTVRYGLLNDDLDELRSFIAHQTPFEAQLGEIELFPVSEHSEGAVPVVALILSPELHAIEAEIGKHADFKEKNFPVYKPHCTLAYCKPEHAESYRNLLVYGSFVVQSITISHQSGVQETIPFGLTQKWNPQQPRDEQGRWETVHPNTIRTEKEMVPAKGAADIMAHARAGRMPLDAEKVKALEKIIRAGGELPPLDVREDGVLNDGHHRLQAFRNVGATSVRIIRKKWDPNQPRDEKGRFKGLGLHGSEVTVLHGTTRANAEAILAGGFKQGNPKAVAEQIEREYGLPEGSIYGHVAFEFARGRRDLDEVHFTTDESVADQYAVPEVMQDALTAAHSLLHPHPEDEPYTKEHHAQRKAWVTEQANRLREPALLAVTVPFETVGQHSFGRALTLAEFQEIQRKFPKSEDWFNNIRIPITALREARVERWKREGSKSFHNRPHWAESKHPRHPAGSSQGGEFMATLHGPRDAVDALLNEDRDVNIQAGDVRRFMEIAGELPEGIDPDLTKLLVEGQKIFGGTNGLGIIRDDMPQIPPEHRDQFLEFLEQEHGVKVTRGERVDPLTLRPTQSQVSARRAGAKLKKYEDNPNKKFSAVLVSNADRILDGHHHWGMMAAFALEAPGARMPVTRIHLPTRKTLALMHAYMKRHGLKRATLAGSTVAKADPATGRYVTPFVSFEKQGDNLLRMIASLNSSRLATWGFTAEAEVLGMVRYKLTAVLDGRTSKFCRLVAHGKIFDVVDARAKVIEALNVQNPEDLRQVQPWPKQDKASMAMYAEMSNAELVERGLHIPPYHPHCRTILRHVQSSVGKAKEPPVPTLPAGVETFHPITAADLRELGIEATPEQVAQWNETVGMSPVELISKLTGMPPVEVLTKGKGVGANPVQIDPDGNVGVRARGTTPSGVEFKLNAILDPFTGIFYLNEAALIAGTPAAELKFLKNLFTELIDTGLKTSASSVAVGVAGNAAYYARMGFLPDDIEWDGLRMHTLQELETGSLQPLFKSLTPNDQVLVKQLLQDKSASALSALVELPFTFEGRTLGEWILAEASGTWGLDLLDPSMVAHAKSYLT